jgi:sugar phosphate isomerase/epimerase
MAKPISVQLYSVRDIAAEDFPATLKKIADIGFVGVEFAGLHDMCPCEVKKIIDDLGMVASSSHLGMPTPETVSEMIDTAGVLGYKYLITGFGPPDFETADKVKETAAKFQAGAALLAGTGLTLGMHNHWWEFSQKIDGRYAYDLVLEEAPDLASELDVYWSTYGGADTPAVVATNKARIPLLHVKDGCLCLNHPHTAVGKGRVDFANIIAAACPSTLEWLIVELDSCATDMLEAVADSYKYLVGSGMAEGRK